MMLRMTRRGLVGWMLAVVLGWPAALAQEAPPKPLADPPPATQPGAPTSREGAEALEKLLKLKEEMQREEQERAARGQAETRPPRTPPGAPPPAAPAARGALEELQAQAKASTQRATPPAPPPAGEYDPDEFVGPPASLAPDAAPADGRRPGARTPEELRAARARQGEEPDAAGDLEAEEAEAREGPGRLTRRTRDTADEDGRTEWFNFDNAPWEDVIQVFVDRIGKPLLGGGDLVIDGTLTYKSDRKFTKEEAIDELNLIMHEQGYRFVEQEHHVRVIPVSEMPQWVPLDHVYPSVEAFLADNPRDMDYVTVYYKVPGLPAQTLVDMFIDALPDYTRLSTLKDSNQIKIAALARDVREFLALKDMIDIVPGGPEQIEIFKIKTNAGDIERRVRDLLDIRGGTPTVQMVRDPRTGRMIPQRVPAAPAEGSDVKMVADERTNSIIVKATPEKIGEIRGLIETLDQMPDIGEFKTWVIEVRHADAADVANLLNQILQQELGDTRVPNWQLQRQLQQAAMQRGVVRGQPQPPVVATPGGVSPEEILTEGIFERAKKTIRLVADTRTNSLIVYATADGHKRVLEMLEIIDKPLPDRLRTFVLAHARVGDVAPLLTEIVRGMAQAGARGGGPTIVTDEAANALHVIAERPQMEQVEKLIVQLDVAAPEQVRHVVALKKLRPSQVAQMVQSLLSAGSGGAAAAGPALPPRLRRPGAPQPGGGVTRTPDFQIIPLDEAQILLVYCPDEDWARIEETIRLWDDNALTNTPELEIFPVERGNAQAIAATLQTFYRSYDHPTLGRTPVAVQAEGETVLVSAVRPALEEIRGLIRTLDVESASGRFEILPLTNADAAQVAQTLQGMFISAVRGRPGAAAPLILAEPLTNSLVVQAEKSDLDKIKDFALQMDQRIAAQATEQRFFTMRYARPQDVAAAVQSIFGGQRVRGGVSVIKAMAAGSQVIVEAPHDKLAAITEFIAKIDTGKDIQVKVFKLAGCDVNQIAQIMTTTSRNMQPRPDGLQATFTPDMSTESVIVVAPADMLPQIDEMMSTYVVAAEDLTPERRFYPIKVADANYVAELLRAQLVEQVRSRTSPTVAARVSIGVDSRQNQVIINAPKFVHPLAEELIAALDQKPTREVPSWRIALQHADVTTVATLLRPQLQEKARREQQNRSYVPVVLTPDTLTNTLLVYGGDEADRSLLAEEVQRMDAEAAALEQPPVTIAPKYGDPTQIAQMIQTMFRSGAGKSQQQDVQVTVSNGLLVIRAPKNKVEEIRGLVAAVDTPDTGGVQVKAYDLKVLNALQVQAQVAMFLAQMRKNVKPGQLAPGAFAEPTTNTLVVLAPPDVLPVIDGLIQELEGKVPPTGRVQAYALQHVRAEQIAGNVDAMLKAKVAEREGVKSNTLRTAVFSDAASNRLFVFAPDEYQELAARLVEMVDAEVESGEIVHIVTLETGDAQQVAQTINQIIAGGRGGAGAPGARSGTANVRVTADPGSNALVLAGLAKDLAEVERWIGELEQHSATIPELKIFDLRYASPEDVRATLQGLMGGPVRGAQPAVTVTTDAYSSRVYVTATRRTMRQVEAWIEQLDQAPAVAEGGLPGLGGRELYFVDIARGDASDIAWDVQDVLGEAPGGPEVEADWFGEYIRVTCRPGEFPQILKLIREFEGRAKVEQTAKVIKLRGDVDRVIEYLGARRDDLVIERVAAPPGRATLVEELWAEGEEPPVRRRPRVRPAGSESDGGARFETGLPLSAVLLGTLADEPPVPGAPPPASAPAGAGAAAADEPAGAGAEPRRYASPFERPRTRVYVAPDGTVLLQGSRDDVNDVVDAIELMQEDLEVGETIKIFRFRYGDVSAAAEILTMMFDVQPRQQVIIQPPQQQRPGQRPGEEGREREQPGLMEQLRGMVGGRQPAGRQAARQLRIATDPGHNYLIVKCDQSMLPEIRQLLRELDIPPGEVEIRVFQLKNLAAEETARNISDVLGISKVRERRTGAVPGRRPTTGGPQQQLMEMLQQQLVSVGGVEGGAKVERVEIVPNTVTNSLMVSAPPEVMGLIEEVITELESKGGIDIVGIHHYELVNARVDDLLPLLQEIFDATTGGGGGAGPRGARAAVSPAALGPVTVSGDPRTNTIIYTAEAKDVPVVEEQIRRLDLAGPLAEAETYVCVYGDAETIAQQVEPIYAEGAAGRAGRGARGGAAAPAAGGDVRIVASNATNSILVWGPPDKRRVILAKIEELDRLSKREIREIPVQFAKADELAATLMEIFGGAGSAGGAGRPRRGAAVPAAGGPAVLSTGRILIVGDKDAKKLLVRAPDDVFAQIVALVDTLDQPSEQLQLRRYTLTHADAAAVVESVKAGLAEYMQVAKAMGSEAEFDAFTAMPDPRTNSIIVVGSNETFLFVEQILAGVDVETPAAQRKEFRVFMLEKVDAVTVADAINGFAAGGDLAAVGGRRPGVRGAAPGAAAGGARELNVFAVAEETTNSVMVYGRPADIDLVEVAVIARLEDTLSERTQIATIEVRNVPPSQVLSFIWQFIEQGVTAAAGGQRRPGDRGSLVDRGGPQIVPNDNAKTLVVRGTKRQIEEVRELVERFDSPDIVSMNLRIVQVPYGQDAARLAGELERIINQSEEEIASRTGRTPRRVTVGADEYTNTLIVAGDPTMFGMVETIVAQLGEVRTDQVVTRVIEFVNLSADDAEQIISEIQQGPRGGTSGRSGATRPPGTRQAPGTPRRTPAAPSGGGTRRPSTRSPAPPPAGARPSGGAPAGGGGGGRSLLDPDGLPGAPERPRVAGAGLWVAPYIGVLAPAIAVAGPGDEPARGESPRPAPGAQPAPPARSTGAWAFQPVGWNDLLDEPGAAPPRARRTAETAPATRPAVPAGGDAAAGGEVSPAPADEPAGEAVEAPATARALVGDMLTGVTGSLRGQVTAKAVDSQRLIITGDASDVEFIEQVLRMMESSASPADIEVFALQHAKATALAPIIEKAMQAKVDIRTRSPGPQDRFSINAEGRSNSLIVSASRAMMEQIAELVTRLDKPTEETSFRTIPLAHMRAANAVAILKPTLEKLNRLREVPTESQASVQAIAQTNSVLIIGTPQDVSEIERLVQEIDVEVAAEDRPGAFLAADVVLIQLQNGSAEDVAKVLTDLIKEQQDLALKADPEKPGEPFVKVLRLRLADGRELPALNLERPIRIIPERGTNSLIVFSSKDNNAALQAIVGVFDTLPVGVDTDVKAFALRHAAAEDVAKLLQEIFDKKRYLRRPAEGSGDSFEKGVLPPVPPGLAARGLPYPVLVQHDARSNTVVVIGREDAVLLAGGLISELDRPTLALGLRPYVLELKRMGATELAEKLDALLSERAKALGADRNTARDSAVIEPDERSNALIVLATEEIYDMIEDLALQLDAAPKYSVIDLRYRPLRYADAAKLRGLLDEMFKAKQEAESKTNKEAKDSLTVLADLRSNALLLTGTRDYLDEAETLLARLDQESAGTVVFRALKVRLNSAANIAGLLQDMIEKALKQTDSKLSGTPIHVAADPITDSLLIAAAQEDLDLIERWVQILDRPSEVGRMTLIVPLRRALAEDVSKSVQEIFRRPGGQQQGGEIDVTVTADKTTNAVVAFGPPALLADVERFVRQIDETTATRHRSVRIFKLQQADAEVVGELLIQILEGRSGAVGGRGGGTAQQEAAAGMLLIYQEQVGAEVLQAMRADIVVISDIRTNSLVVTAPPDSMRLMESLIAAVDVPPDAAKIRVFRLRNADAEQMVETLERLFERQTAARTGGAARTGAQESERVLTLAEGLGAGGGRQEIAFTTDVRTNSVIAAGTPGYLDLVEQFILELDTVPIEDRETFVYSPKNLPAATLSQSLKEYSEANQRRLEAIGQEVSIAVRQEREIVAIANEDANRVVIDVDPRFKSAVMRVVEELDQPPPQVIIQVLIVEVTVDNELDIGVEFAFQDLQYAKAGVTDTTTFDYVGGTDVGAAGSGLGGFTFTITGADFNFLFRTLQSEGNLKVLSRPQIVAMDNQEASIDISNDVPYVTGTSTTTGGQITTSVARERIGIKLTVTPQINPDGFVRMEVTQEVSDFSGSTVDVGQGVTAPVFFRREAKTNIMVKDNETVVLGGLITSRTENREQKVPILGDIPLLGLLFRNQTDTMRRTELLLVLTPHVVRTPEDYRRFSLAERDHMQTIPEEMLRDPLMQGLQLKLEQLEAAEGAALQALPVPLEPPVSEDSGTREERYGPLRPALRPGEPRRPPDPNSYDVPLSYAGPR